MTIKKINTLAVGLVAAGIFNMAHATSAGSYLGFMVGESNMNNKTQDVQLGTNPETASSVTPTNTGISGGLIIGYQANPYAAGEFGYTHFASSTYAKPEGSQLNHDSIINTNAVDLALKGSYPFKAINIFGKLGMIYVSASGSGSLSPIGEGRQPNNNALRPMYAVGAGYDITQNWVVNLYYLTFTAGGGVQASQTVALDLSYHFVDLMCGQFLC